MAHINADLLSFKEAARETGLTYNTIKKYASKGLISKVIIGTGVFILRKECAKYNKHRNPRGNPLLVKAKSPRRKTG